MWLTLCQQTNNTLNTTYCLDTAHIYITYTETPLRHKRSHWHNQHYFLLTKEFHTKSKQKINQTIVFMHHSTFTWFWGCLWEVSVYCLEILTQFTMVSLETVSWFFWFYQHLFMFSHVKHIKNNTQFGRSFKMTNGDWFSKKAKWLGCDHWEQKFYNINPFWNCTMWKSVWSHTNKMHRDPA